MKGKAENLHKHTGCPNMKAGEWFRMFSFIYCVRYLRLFKIIFTIN